MSRWKNRFTALAVCLSAEFLALGLFTKVFTRTTEIPLLLKTAAHVGSRGVKLDSVQEPASDFVPLLDDQPTRDVVSAKECAGTDFRTDVVDNCFLTTLFTPKVSRYLANSVLIL